MGIWDWFKSLGKDKPEQDESPEGVAATKPVRPRKRGKQKAPPLAANDPSVPGWHRRVLRDERLLPKPPKKNYWDKSDPVFDTDTAGQLFSSGFRTSRPALRSLVADEELLRQRGLPVWLGQSEVADALELSIGELRWLACHRFDDAITHYTRFRVPKRSGGHRTIMAPKKRLKRAQRRLLQRCLSKLPVTEHAHGFVAGRSVRTNAEPHVGKAFVARFDLEDFFGTVTFGRVRGYLIAMGYGFEVATTLALLATEAERQPVDVDGALHWVPIGHRTCVQGAPTSPVLCNAIAGRMDRRLAAFAAANGLAYTRYADDLSFSGNDPSQIGKLLRIVADVVTDEGFRLNVSKTRIMRAGGRQRVTGVTVNQTLGLSRKQRRLLRAKIHGMSETSPPAEIAKLRGELNWVAMLNRAQADALWPVWLPR